MYSNTTVHSYLVELRNIAVNSRLLSSTTLAKLQKAEILIGSRRVRRQESDKETDNVRGDEEEQGMEYDLLAPDKVAIADDVIILQQFGEEIFCAPQEEILEGEHDSTCPQHFVLTLETIDFYQSLGCKQLSDLVEEKYQTEEEVHGSTQEDHRSAQEVRLLILERLLIFLHDCTHTTVSLEWLNNEENFIVQKFKKITATKSITISGDQLSRSFEVSATAGREGKGPIRLWLSDNTQMDMHEIANSLCRLLFNTQKVNDTFLFTIILSTTLDALQRQGYHGSYTVPFIFTLLTGF